MADNISFDGSADLLHVRYGVLINESDEDNGDEDHGGDYCLKLQHFY